VRALTDPERQHVLDVLHSDRFVDVAPEEAWATLLDEGTYLCSTRTMYRILAAQHGTVRDRRAQLTHPPYNKPELLATRPNELWSWDISKLKAATRGSWYFLYVILDVFSRYIVGWTVRHHENGELAKALIEQAISQQPVTPSVLHADRGAPMRSKHVSELLDDLGVGSQCTSRGQSLISRSNGAAGTLILRPFRRPLVTWIASSSPRWTLCNTVWRAHPSRRAASASGT
jgi:putative transposase